MLNSEFFHRFHSGRFSAVIWSRGCFPSSSPLPVKLTCHTCVCLPFSVFFPLCSRSSCVHDCLGQHLGEQALVTIFLACLLICRQLNRAQHRSRSSPPVTAVLSGSVPRESSRYSGNKQSGTYRLIKSREIVRRVAWLFAPPFTMWTIFFRLKLTLCPRASPWLLECLWHCCGSGGQSSGIESPDPLQAHQSASWFIEQFPWIFCGLISECVAVFSPGFFPSKTIIPFIKWPFWSRLESFSSWNMISEPKIHCSDCSTSLTFKTTTPGLC